MLSHATVSNESVHLKAFLILLLYIITYKLFRNILLSNTLTTTMYTTKINFHINKLYGIHLSL